ncbi:hypothetical protein AABB24_035561 [Solanum stoloniferum]|uniref:Ribosomal RNA methyltransferase FtsJ domain-containing protein n=1 Tax=Solanum stoloniferum TaxID=62892 RepID=A0ABD2R993_9SOLN
MQVAVSKTPVGSLVIGVDIVPIKPISRAIAVQEDITTANCKSTIKSIIAEKGCSGFDLILHDGSPNMGGAWAMEAQATVQSSLVIDLLSLLHNFCFLMALLLPRDYMDQMNYITFAFECQLFEKVEVEKPLASRSESAEIYLIGFKYKAPAKIDPSLLDIRHLFQGGKEPLKVVDVLRATKQKRHRDGWHKLMRKALAPSETINNPKVVIECEREEDEDTRFVKEMEELKETELRKTKREKRVLAKRQAKDKAREVLGMQSDAAEDGFADPELFSLT